MVKRKCYSYFSITVKTIVPVMMVACVIAACTEVSKIDTSNAVVRIARLQIDTMQLETYKAALKEEIDSSLKLEPGVLTLYAVSDKANPTHITVFEIYSSDSSYRSHIKTPHFLKYKTGTSAMVKSLELVETVPISINAKPD